MPRIEFAHLRELKDRVGQEIAVSDWLEMTQERVNLFAQATGDHQWIHVDPARAQRESPFGAAIAHGFLTLSLLSKFLGDSIAFASARMGVNYGLNRVRFTAPVPVGARVRARLRLRQLEDIDPQGQTHGVQMTWDVTLEREGSDKPCLVAEWLTRRYE
ncbi:MAG: MaoC family dehydratase [Burkholderiales bacterium]|nr:MaoC family dehydratase [Burkholderiales bacterium]